MEENVNDPIHRGKKIRVIFDLSQFGCKMNIYLVTGRLFFSIDTKENGFFCVVALHLHHDVIFLGLLFGAARPGACSRDILQHAMCDKIYILLCQHSEGGYL